MCICIHAQPGPEPAVPPCTHVVPQVIKLNLYSCFNIVKASAKRMMGSGGGAIVLCSSAVAKHGIPNHEAIAAAKAGVVGGWARGVGGAGEGGGQSHRQHTGACSCMLYMVRTVCAQVQRPAGASLVLTYASVSSRCG